MEATSPPGPICATFCPVKLENELEPNSKTLAAIVF